MSFEQNSALPKRFVTGTLPWLVGLGALLVYLATMNHWANFSSVGIVARVSGWVWNPELQQPLVFLALYPFRFLPAAVIPLALNIFNVVLAALTLVLLARTVALLPHDRTPDQRELEEDEHGIFSGRGAWIPPVLAALALGLQISFWENATAITGEMIDVLLVAYVIRCLMEFRVDQQQRWLSRAALLYAVGMTNNWALVGLSPIFLTAIIWLKGLAFFNLRFLGRMMLWGLAGLLLYLLLPLVQSLATIAPVDFRSGLELNLRSQLGMLGGMYRFLKDNYRVVVFAATSLLPLLVIAMRWRSSFGDNSPLGIFIAKAVFHFVHALFLGVCLLVVLSPPYSPRQMVPGMPFLAHYYFGAIAIGYCAGYFLLICGAAFRRRSRMHPILKGFGYAGFGAIVAALVLMPVILIARNLEAVRLANGRLVEDFVTQMERELPKEPCALVSDTPSHLALLHVHLQQQKRDQGYLFYDTQSAPWSDYHVFQRRLQPDRWPAMFASLTNHSQIKDIGLIYFLRELTQKQPVFYLQPTFGYYLEVFEMLPRGLAYQLADYPTNRLLRAPLSTETIGANEKFWSEFDNTTLPLLRKCLSLEGAPRKPRWQAALLDRFHLDDEHSPAATALAHFYSRASTYWGVEMQKLGKWEEAAPHLQRALVLNPENVSAQVTLEFNESRRGVETRTKTTTSAVEDRFGRYQGWNQVLNDCGPFDDPRFTFEQARMFLSGRLSRQGLQQIQRVVELEPTNYVATIWLADLYSAMGQPTEALRIIGDIRSRPKVFEPTPIRELDLARVEATAHFRLGEKDAAHRVLSGALKSPIIDNPYRAIAAQLYLQGGMHAEALPLLDRILADNPGDVGSLANRGYAFLQLGRYDEAKESLTRALELDPKNGVVRLNRAITLLRAKQYDAAREDYELLLKEFPQAYQVHFGLGEIAAATSDLPKAISHFETCLKIAPPGTPDFLQVSNRLAEVQAQKK